MTDPKPVAWMYEPTADRPVKDRPFAQPNRANMDPRYWTETPLYAAPQPCTDCDKLRAEVERLMRACIKAAAPDFMTQAERDALHDFVQFLRSTEGGEARQILDCEPSNKSPKKRSK